MLPILIVPDAWYDEDALVDIVRRASAPATSYGQERYATSLAAALQASFRRTADLRILPGE